MNEPDKPPSFWSLFSKSEPTESPSLWSLFAKPEPEESDSGSTGESVSSDIPPEGEPVPCALTFQQDRVFWAMQDLPVEEATKHFMMCGTTGSGKTIAIRLFLQSIAERFHTGTHPPEQLILFDVKGDMIPLLEGLGLGPEHDNVYILNPYDRRSRVWNLGDATRTPLMARAVAALLVPEERNSTAPFFADAGRELVYAVLLALNARMGREWDFSDLLCALDSRENIADVTAGEARANRIAKRILGDSHHSPAVLSTLATKVGRYEQVAALWQSCSNPVRFSIEKFLSEPGVLVLGNDPVLRESLWPINAVLLKALTNEILRRGDQPQPRYWFVLDEFRAMERVDCIHDLLNRGRSKGASVLLGIQSIEGLYEVYGEHGANDILSQCANKVFLRAGSHKTAGWAEEHFGRVRQYETSVTEASSLTDSSRSVNRSLQERSMFLASMFLNLPFPKPGGAYVAVCDVPCLRESLIVRRHFDEVLSLCLPPGTAPAVDPREDEKNQSLSPWDKDRRALFCSGRSGDSESGKPDAQGDAQDWPNRRNTNLPGQSHGH